MKKRLVLKAWVKDLLLECLGLLALAILIQSIILLYLMVYGG